MSDPDRDTNILGSLFVCARASNVASTVNWLYSELGLSGETGLVSIAIGAGAGDGTYAVNAPLRPPYGYGEGVAVLIGVIVRIGPTPPKFAGVRVRVGTFGDETVRQCSPMRG